MPRGLQTHRSTLQNGQLQGIWKQHAQRMSTLSAQTVTLASRLKQDRVNPWLQTPHAPENGTFRPSMPLTYTVPFRSTLVETILYHSARSGKRSYLKEGSINLDLIGQHVTKACFGVLGSFCSNLQILGMSSTYLALDTYVTGVLGVKQDHMDTRTFLVQGQTLSLRPLHNPIAACNGCCNAQNSIARCQALGNLENSMLGGLSSVTAYEGQPLPKHLP
jgi:hypothetical protein